MDLQVQDEQMHKRIVKLALTSSFKQTTLQFCIILYKASVNYAAVCWHAIKPVGSKDFLASLAGQIHGQASPSAALGSEDQLDLLADSAE